MSDENDVKVFVRFRPSNARESTLGDRNIWKRQDAAHLKVLKPVSLEDDHAQEWAPFTFDHVLDESTTQQQMYEAVGKPMLDDVLSGFNCSMMVYGMTGSGKTTTMMGPHSPADDSDEAGIIPRFMGDLFAKVEEQKATSMFSINCSVLEIYMEKINDLLKTSNKNLRIREVVKKGKHSGKTVKSYVYVENCSVFKVNSFKDMARLIKKSAANRTTAATAMNANSSRSHSVFIVTVTQTDLTTQTRKSSKIMLVDLAGSEQVSKSKVVGLQLEQAKHVNQSLTTLALVIRSLTDNSQEHVPYRNSKLTRLLSDSLGGNSKTALILTCSPSEDNLRETYSTLCFGQRAKKMENSARVNKDLSLKAYRMLVAELKKKLHVLTKRLTMTEGDRDMYKKMLIDHGHSVLTPSLVDTSGALEEDSDNESVVSDSESTIMEVLDTPGVAVRRKSIPFHIEHVENLDDMVEVQTPDENDEYHKRRTSSIGSPQFFKVEEYEPKPEDTEVELVDSATEVTIIEPEPLMTDQQRFHAILTLSQNSPSLMARCLCELDEGKIEPTPRAINRRLKQLQALNAADPLVDTVQNEQAIKETLQDLTLTISQQVKHERTDSGVKSPLALPDNLEDLCVMSMQDVLIWSTDDMFYFQPVAKKRNRRKANKSVSVTHKPQ